MIITVIIFSALARYSCSHCIILSPIHETSPSSMYTVIIWQLAKYCKYNRKVYSVAVLSLITGDTGLRGPVGEAGIPGAKGAKGDQGN